MACETSSIMNGKISKTGASAGSHTTTPPMAARSEVDSFLARAQELGASAPAAGAGRLIFAADATMSRQPTWDLACTLQAQMFEAAAGFGGLVVQLVYFRGFGECRASPWVGDARRLSALMAKITVQGGETQIGRVLAHVRTEAGRSPVRAFIFVGDAMEEDVDRLCALAGELGVLGVRGFMFQEGGDPRATAAFREIARLTGGAHARFDTGSSAQLLDLLKAASAYAAGGRSALQRLAGQQSGARLLIEQMGGKR